MTTRQGNRSTSRRRVQGRPSSSPDPEDLKRIIQDENATSDLVAYATALGEQLGRDNLNLSTSQIRALFGEVRRIEAMWPKTGTEEMTAEQGHADGIRIRARKRLTLMKPKMMYRVGKETGKSKKAIETLVNSLEPALDAVLEPANDPQVQRARLERFVEFFEAILAYHRYFGGK